MLPFDMILSAAGTAGQAIGAKAGLQGDTAGGNGSGQFASVLNAAVKPDQDADALTEFAAELPVDLVGELASELVSDLASELTGELQPLPVQPVPSATADALFENLLGTGQGEGVALQIVDVGEPVLPVAPLGAGAGPAVPPNVGEPLPVDPLEPVLGAKPAAGTLAPVLAQGSAGAPSTGEGQSAASANGANPVAAALTKQAAEPTAPGALLNETVQAGIARGGAVVDAAQPAQAQAVSTAGIVLAEKGTNQTDVSLPAKKWQADLPAELRSTLTRVAQGEVGGQVSSSGSAPLVDTAVSASQQKPVNATAASTVSVPPIAEEPVVEPLTVTAEDGAAEAEPLVTAAAKKSGEPAQPVVQVAQAAQNKPIPVKQGGGLQAPLADDAPPVSLADLDAAVEEAQPSAASTKKTPAASHAGAGSEAPQQTPASPKPEILAAAAARSAVSSGEVEFDAEFDPEAALRLTGTTGESASTVRLENVVRPNQTLSSHVAMQVAGEMARNIQNGQTKFQMRFDPPELGRVDVKMKVSSDGSVQAHLIVERPETLDMFMRDQRGLERALEAAGLTADSENMKFSLKDQGNSGSQFADGQQDGDQHNGASGKSEADQYHDHDEFGPAVPLNIAAATGGLDVRI